VSKNIVLSGSMDLLEDNPSDFKKFKKTANNEGNKKTMGND